jgi:hypothetical protein
MHAQLAPPGLDPAPLSTVEQLVKDEKRGRRQRGR